MTGQENAIACPGCGQQVALAEAREKGRDDEQSTLTCPTCGAGFDRQGNLTHEPAIGP
jgi:endogenous inhibitor of DNA gyrase (YacG/DUF329 family)